MKILLADDQPDVLEALRLLVKAEGFTPALARSPAAVLAAVEAGDFDVVLLDLNYTRDTTSGREGLDLLPRLLELAWVLRVAALEKRLDVRVDEGPAMVVPGDEDQLEQLLINLVRNAADAALSVGGGVRVRWRAAGARVEIAVEDEGPGLPESGNLFVPFFTTKPQGSGIGLILSRQIAEAHGGLLRLENRTDTRGCAAILALPRGEGPPAVTDPRPR